MVKNSQEPMYNALIDSVMKEDRVFSVEFEGTGISGEDGKKKKRSYKQCEDEDKIIELSHKNFAGQSKLKIRWTVNLYDDWHNSRVRQLSCAMYIKNANLNAFFSFEKQDLAYSLIRFVTEIKKLDGNKYPPQTVGQIVIMIQMYLHENGL